MGIAGEVVELFQFAKDREVDARAEGALELRQRSRRGAQQELAE